MTPATGNRDGFARRLHRMGLSWDSTKPYLLAEDGDTITVDVDHPAYPRKPQTPGAGAARAPHKSGPERWAELHRRAAEPVTDPAAEIAWITALADGLEGCGCVAHWQAYVASNPPAVDSAEAYTQWAMDAHDAVNVRLGKPQWQEQPA